MTTTAAAVTVRVIVAQPSQLLPAEYEEHLAQLDDLLGEAEEEGR